MSDNNKTKICNKCDKLKFEDEFYKTSGRTCKNCTKEYYKIKRIKNKIDNTNAILEYQRKMLIQDINNKSKLLDKLNKLLT